MKHTMLKAVCSEIALCTCLIYLLLFHFGVDAAGPPAAPRPPAPGKLDSFNGTTAIYQKRLPVYNNSLAQQFLVLQNQARSQLRETPLVWDERVAAYARWYAERRRSDCALRHSFGPYGENIFWGSGKNWQPYDAVVAWVSEKKYYDNRRNSCVGNKMCGHYTQIVWKNTRSLGCARVVCYNGQIFMTCNYFPPGNYIGQKPY
jgi:uncharacterized protein YkwD